MRSKQAAHHRKRTIAAALGHNSWLRLDDLPRRGAAQILSPARWWRNILREMLSHDRCTSFIQSAPRASYERKRNSRLVTIAGAPHTLLYRVVPSHVPCRNYFMYYVYVRTQSAARVRWRCRVGGGNRMEAVYRTPNMRIRCYKKKSSLCFHGVQPVAQPCVQHARVALMYTVTERIQSDTTRAGDRTQSTERDARDPQEKINTKRHPLARPPAPRLCQLQYRPTID